MFHHGFLTDRLGRLDGLWPFVPPFSDPIVSSPLFFSVISIGVGLISSLWTVLYDPWSPVRPSYTPYLLPSSTLFAFFPRSSSYGGSEGVFPRPFCSSFFSLFILQSQFVFKGAPSKGPLRSPRVETDFDADRLSPPILRLTLPQPLRCCPPPLFLRIQLITRG